MASSSCCRMASEPEPAGQHVGQRPADAVQDRRSQQQVADLGGLAFEHLREQVRRHGALAAGELGDEALRDPDARRARSRPAAARPPSPRCARAGVRRPRPGARCRLPRAACRSPPARSADRRRGSPPGSRSGAGDEARAPDPRGSTARPAASAAPGSGRARASGARPASGARAGRRSPGPPAPRDSSSPESSGSTTPSARNAGVAPTRSTRPFSRTAPASASTTDSQKCCASSSPRSTDTQPTRSGAARDSDHERSRTVLPLPAGAQSRTTCPGPALDSRSNSALRGTRRCIAGTRSRVAGKGCRGVSRGSAVLAGLVMTIGTRPCTSLRYATTRPAADPNARGRARLGRVADASRATVRSTAYGLSETRTTAGRDAHRRGRPGRDPARGERGPRASRVVATSVRSRASR